MYPRFSSLSVAVRWWDSWLTLSTTLVSMTWWRWISYLIPIVALVIPFVANEYLLWVVNAILVYILVTVGFNIVIGNLGQLAFVSTAFFGIGAYTTAILMVYTGIPYALAIVASAVAGGLAGFLTSVTALRGIRLYYLAIITLAFGELMRWVYLHGDKVTSGSDGLLMPQSSFLGVTRDSEVPKFYVFLLLTVLVVKATSNLMQSRFGCAFVAIRDNEASTASLGIHTARYIVLAFVWSGAVVGSTLQYHAEPSTLAIGAFSGFLVALFAIWLVVRRQAGPRRARVRDEPG